MKIKKTFTIFLTTIFLLVIMGPLLIRDSQAATLGESFLFFERMQIGVTSGMTVMFTPSSNFNDLVDGREFRIIFPEVGVGVWCLSNSALTVNAVTTSPIEQGNWTINAGLPGTLSATCNQGGVGENDYIEVLGIGNLASGTSYGFEIIADGAVFKTGANVGTNTLSFQLIEGLNIENISFGVTLLSSDQVVVTAEVSEAETITCTLNTNSVNLGALYRGGAYITANMSLSTQSTIGYYWTVYGTGNGTNAGLYNSTGGGHLLSAAGVEGRVNLLTGEGFGMIAETSQGQVAADFLSDVAGSFGAFGSGPDNSKVFLTGDALLEAANTNIYYGARAGLGALEGSYTETVTYVCGGYFGTTTP